MSKKERKKMTIFHFLASVKLRTDFTQVLYSFCVYHQGRRKERIIDPVRRLVQARVDF